MTVNHVTAERQTVACDTAGCNVTYLGEADRLARLSANRNGWVTINSVDHCPTHAPIKKKKAS